MTYYSRQTSHLEVKNEQHPDYQRREKIRPLQWSTNDTLTEVADGTLRDLGHDVRSFAPTATTMSKRKYKTFSGRCGDLADARLVDGRAVDSEKYIDDVFTEGHGTLYASDGRTAKIRRKNTVPAAWYRAKNISFSDLERTNGSLHRKRSVLPGVGVDGVYLPFHKANQFLGMNRCRHLSLMT